jgi:flagellar basal-body rod modification protein FlgD
MRAMNTIQDTTVLERLNAGLKQATPKHTKELGQDQFFELMIAQLKNQDPTKPLDGQTQIAQLAQFSTVSGIRELQQSFNQLAQSLQSLGALQASSLVGRSVMIASDSAYLADGKPLRGRVEVTENVKDLTVIFCNDSGREIKRLNLGDQSSGEVEFAWDGLNSHGAQVAAGRYQIKAEGTVAAGKTQAFTTQVQALVQSVSLGQKGQDMTLNLTGLGGHSINEIQEIL